MFLEKTVVYIFSNTNTFKSVWKGKENRKPLHLKEIWKRLHTVYQWWPPGYKTSLSSKFFLQGLLSLLHVPWLFALTSKVIVIIWKPNVCIYMYLKKKKKQAHIGKVWVQDTSLSLTDWEVIQSLREKSIFLHTKAYITQNSAKVLTTLGFKEN